MSPVTFLLLAITFTVVVGLFDEIEADIEKKVNDITEKTK